VIRISYINVGPFDCTDKDSWLTGRAKRETDVILISVPATVWGRLKAYRLDRNFMMSDVFFSEAEGRGTGSEGEELSGAAQRKRPVL